MTKAQQDITTQPTQPAPGGTGAGGSGTPRSREEGDGEPLSNPASIRATLVRVIAEAGTAGVTETEAERAVSAAIPRLEDPVDADIDSLVMLGVLERGHGDRVAATHLAPTYALGVKASV